MARPRPGARTRLEQLIRQRDTTYEELCGEYEKLARQMREKSTLSVRHLQRLAYGERSGQQSTPSTRRVMRVLFGQSLPDLLGPPTLTESPESLLPQVVPELRESASIDLADRLCAGAQVDSAAVEALAARTNHLRLMDRQLPGPALALQLTGHVNGIRWLLEHAVLYQQRRPLAAELSDAEALAAWVALDLGDVNAAWLHHEAARLAAREAESPALLAHAMVQQALVLTEIGQPASALDLVQEARTIVSDAVPALMIAWLWASEGEVLAATKDQYGSRSAFDRAARALPDHVMVSELPYIQLDEIHLMRWRGNALARLGDPAAVDDLYRAVRGEDQSLRAKAALHTDLACALTVAGDRIQAQAHLRRAEDFARQAGSIRQRRRIRKLATECQYMQQRH
jgi:tetratricopeptide (TPR) repeat protein